MPRCGDLFCCASSCRHAAHFTQPSSCVLADNTILHISTDGNTVREGMSFEQAGIEEGQVLDVLSESPKLMIGGAHVHKHACLHLLELPACVCADFVCLQDGWLQVWITQRA